MFSVFFYCCSNSVSDQCGQLSPLPHILYWRGEVSNKNISFNFSDADHSSGPYCWGSSNSTSSPTAGWQSECKSKFVFYYFRGRKKSFYLIVVPNT